MVGGLSIAAMAFSLLLSVGMPIGFAIWFFRKHRIPLGAVAIGATIFVVFVLMLEKSMHVYLLQHNPATVAVLSNNWLYAVYGALAAAVFEEGGRYFGFRLLLPHRREWRDGVAYGIGHGGAEAVVVGGLSSAGGLLAAYLIDYGAPGEAEASPALENLLINAPAWFFTIIGWERATTFLFQIALSLIVLYAVRRRSFAVLVLAITVHAIVDFPAALSQQGVIGLWPVEGMLLAIAIGSAIFIVRSKRLFAASEPTGEPPAPPLSA